MPARYAVRTSLPVVVRILFGSRLPRKRVEMLFAHFLRLGRLRLRGPCGAQFEFGSDCAEPPQVYQVGRPATTFAPLCAAQALQASAKSSVSRPHNPAGDNGWLQEMHQPFRAVGMPLSATTSGNPHSADGTGRNSHSTIKTLQRMLELNDLSPVQLCYSVQRNA